MAHRYRRQNGRSTALGGSGPREARSPGRAIGIGIGTLLDGTPVAVERSHPARVSRPRRDQPGTGGGLMSYAMQHWRVVGLVIAVALISAVVAYVTAVQQAGAVERIGFPPPPGRVFSSNPRGGPTTHPTCLGRTPSARSQAEAAWLPTPKTRNRQRFGCFGLGGGGRGRQQKTRMGFRPPPPRAPTSPCACMRPPPPAGKKKKTGPPPPLKRPRRDSNSRRRP